METTVKMIGQVKKSNKEELILETIGVGKGGEQYPEVYYMRHDLPEPPKPGESIQIIGKTAYDGEDGTVWIQIDTCTPVTSNTPHINLARAEGEAVGIFQYFEKSDGKMGFGNGLIKTGDKKWQRGVAFGFLAHKLAKVFKAGAIIRMTGRLRHQQYDKNGTTKEMYEIILDAAHTEVLKAASNVNPYDFIDNAPMEAQPSNDTSMKSLLAKLLKKDMPEMPTAV
jgi:hypothetical protein